MFSISIKTNEKELGKIVKWLETNVEVYDLDISYLKRGTALKPVTRTRRKQEPSKRLAKSEQLILNFFEKHPTRIFHRDAIRNQLMRLNYSPTSSGPILSKLDRLGHINKTMYGQYTLKTLEHKNPDVVGEPESPYGEKQEDLNPEGDDIISVIDNVIADDNSY